MKSVSAAGAVIALLLFTAATQASDMNENENGNETTTTNSMEIQGAFNVPQTDTDHNALHGLSTPSHSNALVQNDTDLSNGPDSQEPTTANNVDIPVDECTSEPCLNDGTCIDLASGYMCVCGPGYTGPQCETKDLCTIWPCMNGGTCHSFDQGRKMECECLDGYFGFQCEMKHEGFACQSNPCLNGGVCQEIQGGTSHTCTCKPGFTGYNCDLIIDCSGEPCGNGAACSEVTEDSDDGRPITTAQCICAPGFTGPTCHDKDICAQWTCYNGGTCHSLDGGESAVCGCHEGFYGTKCEVKLGGHCISNPCENGGVCEEIEGGMSYQCRCKPGFTGPNCATDEICTKNPCKNGGECVREHGDADKSFSCRCTNGYIGKTCNIAVICLSDPCANGGTCFQSSPGQFACKCLPHFTGERCEEKVIEFSARITNTGDLKEGDDLNLVCEINNDELFPEVQYTWLYFPYQTSDKIFAMVGHSKVYTSSRVTTFDDNGRYMCIATSGENIAKVVTIVDIKPATETAVAADAGMEPAMQVPQQPSHAEAYGSADVSPIGMTANIRDASGVIVVLTYFCVGCAFALVLLVTEIKTRRQLAQRQRAERRNADVEKGLSDTTTDATDVTDLASAV